MALCNTPRAGRIAQLLSELQIQTLRNALVGRAIVVCFGSGVDSTAMLVALHVAGIRPDVVTFADTGGEKPETIAHIEKVNNVLREWDWPLIDICRKVPLASTGYADLYGNCLANETMPSLAFGMKSCSSKWKQAPQDQFLKGVKSGPNARPAHQLWLDTRASGQRIVKLIGYDCGPADMRRSSNLKTDGDDFDYAYPLQIVRWARPDCVRAITDALGADMVPVKSACFFCPASKQWELYWLAANHPELLERALLLERNAMTGRHSRFDAVEFGATWEELVRSADGFPRDAKNVGLGRNFAWNQWARRNDVVDDDFRVRRDEDSRARFAALCDTFRDADNALDSRTSGIRIIPVRASTQMELTLD